MIQRGQFLSVKSKDNYMIHANLLLVKMNHHELRMLCCCCFYFSDKKDFDQKQLVNRLSKDTNDVPTWCTQSFQELWRLLDSETTREMWCFLTLRGFGDGWRIVHRDNEKWKTVHLRIKHCTVSRKYKNVCYSVSDLRCLSSAP